jgi:streptomycin 6-kinase
MFSDYLDRWRLVPDGDPIITSTSRLLPVRRDGTPGMLKIAICEEERRGSQLMAWWDGQGAARVLTRAGDAILMERAEVPNALADLARAGHDYEATHIICATTARLHAPRLSPLPDLVRLTDWFSALAPAAETHGGVLRHAARTARQVLAAPADVTALHGDIHHGNILNFGSRGWLAIDPKGLLGDRAFDYANLFCNPDQATAMAPGRLARRIDLVAAAAKLDPRRLLQWILAWAGLSAAFLMEDDLSPDTKLQMAELAAAELEG